MVGWRTACAPSVPVTLELCCGHGHFLASYAERFRSEACIGVDYCRQRIVRADRKARRLALPNLAFVRAEAAEFLEALPDDVRFSRVFVLFPDPWPKKRHRKNRLMSPGFVDALARVCDARAGLFLRTDSADYHAETVAAVEASPYWRVAPEHPWPFEHPTVFQSKCANHYSLAAIRSEAAS
jgi:tRNA (guanine-N7-)-methyltransferase